jgi:tetratricopeptide (TPR) repeat protein
MGEQAGVRSRAVTRAEAMGAGLSTVSWVEPADTALETETRAGGRYVLLEALGAGGMGTVRAAYDRELDRKIALKFLHLESSSPEAYARLKREAQAMARLEHPNVVTVYDVGQLDDGTLFVAMELVAGQNLRTWMKQRRTWREVRDAFLQAGRGLAAAHAVGLVHRDFKPDNVLVGRDGRVRVADFGLAREAGAAGGEGDGGGAPATGDRGVAGTPPYIAPERYDRDTADPRTDQFSFCVALHEALYGLAPFAGDTPESLREAKRAGVLPPAPRGAEVPGWLRAVVVRGLSPRPEERYPRMEALLEAMAADPQRRRRRIAAGAALLVALVAGLAEAQRARGLVCRGADRKLVGLWDEPARAAVRAAFAATRLPYAARAADEVVSSLDRYGVELVAAHTEACEATQLRREQSAAVEDLRMACLQERLAGVGALARLLGGADAQAVENAARAVSGLPPVSDCANVTALEGPLAPPAEPQARARIEALRARLAEAAALRRLSKDDQALALAERTLADAQALGFGPLVAEVLMEVGRVRENLGAAAVAEQRYREAVVAGELGHHDRVVAGAATYLILDVGMTEARSDEGRWWGTLAAAAVERAKAGPFAASEVERSLGELDLDNGRSPEAGRHLQRALTLFRASGNQDLFAHARLLFALGKLAGREGRPDEALASVHQGVALIESELPGHPALARAHQQQAEIAYDLGHYQEALDEYRAALQMDTANKPPGHPAVAGQLADLGLVLAVMGRVDEALEQLAKGRALYEKAYGPDHPRALWARVMTGYALSMKGRFTEALTEMDEAIVKLRAAVKPDNRFLTGALTTYADVALRAERLGEARRAAEEGVAQLMKGLGPDEVKVGAALMGLAAIRVAQGAPADALEHAAHAAKIMEKAYGPEHIDLATSLTALGQAHLGLGHAAEARSVLERAVAIFDKRPPNPTEGAPARLALARALGPSPRSRALAERARADLLATGMDPRTEREAERWLRTGR